MARDSVMALAKRIVEALGGRIQAESRPAQGSRFAVILPERP
jgi:signal transduction histidine kinase